MSETTTTPASENPTTPGSENMTTTETGTTATETTTAGCVVWPCLAYRDADAAIRFLVEVFGFTERACYREGGLVTHAELAWPGGGGIMLGSTGSRGEGDPFEQSVGHSSTYLVTDQPDALFQRATAAGAEVVRELRDEEYGSRGFTVRDPEGTCGASVPTGVSSDGHTTGRPAPADS